MEAMGYHGAQWDIMGHNGISWGTMGYHGVQWDIMGHSLRADDNTHMHTMISSRRGYKTDCDK